jgi:surfactin synthase thioesterase subunit
VENEWFIGFSSAPAPAVRLYMLPYAGGNAGMYADWGKAIKNTSVVGIQYPGRGSRFMEPCLDDANTMSKKLAQMIEREDEHYFFVFGYSMGAILAFETLVALKPSMRQRCLGLFVAARAAPDYQSTITPMHTLNDLEFIDRLQQLGGVPIEILEDLELMDLLMPMLRSDFRLAESYALAHNTKLPIPITALYGETDPYANKVSSMRWSRFTSEKFQQIALPGGHFFINEQINLLKNIVKDVIDSRIAEKRPL